MTNQGSPLKTEGLFNEAMFVKKALDLRFQLLWLRLGTYVFLSFFNFCWGLGGGELKLFSYLCVSNLLFRTLDTQREVC